MVKAVILSLVLLLGFQVGANPGPEYEPEFNPALIFFGLFLGSLAAGLLTLETEEDVVVIDVLEDPFLTGLALGAESGKILAELEYAGWAVEDYFDHITERFILEGWQGDRLLRYAFDLSEHLAEITYAEPHPPDETRTTAYGAWLDVLKETFGEPEVVDSFHHWETGGWVVDIGADDYDFGDGSPATVVLITITRLP